MLKVMQLTVAIFLVSGCITFPGQNETDGEGELTEGETWLLATSSFMNHAGGGSVRAVPTEQVAAPASCTILRENVSYDDDSCEVVEGGDHHVEAPWHVSASFAASGYPLDDPRRWSEKTIDAYNDDGDIIATWHGASDYHPEHRRAIE